MLRDDAERTRGLVGCSFGVGVRCDVAGRVWGDSRWDVSADNLWGDVEWMRGHIGHSLG